MMKLDYLAEVNTNWPSDSIIRLYDFTSDDVSLFIQVLDRLSSDSDCSIILSSLPFIQPLDGCMLVLRSGRNDNGIKKTSAANTFECELTSSSWKRASELAKPFLHYAPHTYQWLYDLNMENNTEFLISQTGEW
jgi:hypothetical protein